MAIKKNNTTKVDKEESTTGSPKIFAIIKTGGKQYKVSVGDTVKIEKIKPEKEVSFDDILFGKKVTASIISEGRYPKVRIFKFQPKKHYQRSRGHVQKYTLIKIESIK